MRATVPIVVRKARPPGEPKKGCVTAFALNFLSSVGVAGEKKSKQHTGNRVAFLFPALLCRSDHPPITARIAFCRISSKSTGQVFSQAVRGSFCAPLAPDFAPLEPRKVRMAQAWCSRFNSPAESNLMLNYRDNVHFEFWRRRIRRISTR